MTQIPLFLGIYFVGLCLTYLILRSAPMWFLHSAGFFVGLFNWVFVGILVTLFAGKFYFLPVVIINILELILCLFLLIKAQTKILNRKSIIVTLIGSLLIIIVGLFFEYHNITNISPDSLNIIKMGVDFNRYGFGKFLWETPASFGVFISMLHAASNFLGIDYLYLLQPIISVNFIIFFVFSLFELLGTNKWENMLFSLICAGFLFSSSIMRFEFSYIHTNVISAAYIFIAFLTICFFKETNNERWLMVMVLMLLGFNLSRTENVFLSLLLLFILTVQIRGFSKFAKKPLIAFLIFNLLWEIILLAIVVKNPDSMLRSGQLISTIVIILMFGLYTFISDFQKIRNWLMKGFLWKYSVLMILVFGISLLANPQNIIISIKSNVIAALVTGGWDLTWPLICGLLFMVWPKKSSNANFFLSKLAALWLIGFYAFILAINIFRAPYHTGWGDSANRIFTEMLPVFLLLLTDLIKNKEEQKLRPITKPI